jgi:hypothetical protein
LFTYFILSIRRNNKDRGSYKTQKPRKDWRDSQQTGQTTAAPATTNASNPSTAQTPLNTGTSEQTSVPHSTNMEERLGQSNIAINKGPQQSVWGTKVLTTNPPVAPKVNPTPTAASTSTSSPTSTAPNAPAHPKQPKSPQQRPESKSQQQWIPKAKDVQPKPISIPVSEPQTLSTSTTDSHKTPPNYEPQRASNLQGNQTQVKAPTSAPPSRQEGISNAPTGSVTLPASSTAVIRDTQIQGVHFGGYSYGEMPALG